MEFAEMKVEKGEDIKLTIVNWLMVNKVKTALFFKCYWFCKRLGYC